MNDPIDYSRPVGWWCPVCGTGAAFTPGLVKMEDAMVAAVTRVGLACCGNTRVIPRYLPIPEGQRPLVEDEVTTGEAEVVTSYSSPSPSTPFTVVRSGNRRDTVLEGMDLAATIQRIVTGATE